MSEPPNTSAIIPHDHHHHHQHHFPHQPPPPLTSPTTTTTIATTTTTSSVLREYRKGNWTLHETLVLITAKKMDDERRQNTTSSSSTTTTKSNIPTPPNHSSSSSHHRTAELRWKWVENYCWKHGCMRSQNQCNDKWDNLLRDYKKVREYQLRVIDTSSKNNDVVAAATAATTTTTSTSSTVSFPSYWAMEKHERKERNLPTNLLSEVFEALNEVVHRRYNNTPTTITPKTSSEPSNKPTHSTVIVRPQLLPPPPPPPPLQQQPPPPPLSPPPPPPAAGSETSDSSETDWSDSNTKRRKVRSLGSSIVRSASVLARTLVECEEKKDRRHRHVMELEERKLQIKETRNEVNKQGFTGLIAAVNNLSGAIQAFVSNRHNTTT